MGKRKKIEKRKERFEKLVDWGYAFCAHHGEQIYQDTLRDKRCYLGNRGERPCPHFKDIRSYCPREDN